ncbi:MAG: uracil phosphoribosyltransferase [Planctomycetota bacterium]|jgi:uracil phosphoribosyltransferase
MTPPHPDHPNLRIPDHPLLTMDVARLRDRDTPATAFRRIVAHAAGLLAYDACRDLPLRRTALHTPYEAAEGHVVDRPVTVVPILRAGLAMADGVLGLVPDARVGHVGITRDESTFEPRPYACRLPLHLAEDRVLIVDPMLATGGTAAHAAGLVKTGGGRDVMLLCLVAAPEGVRRMASTHPDVPVFAAALDRQLDPKRHIRPGIGDAGDRLYGTEDAPGPAGQTP